MGVVLFQIVTLGLTRKPAENSCLDGRCQGRHILPVMLSSLTKAGLWFWKAQWGDENGSRGADDCEVLFRWGVRHEARNGDGKGKVTSRVVENWRLWNEIIRAFEHLLGEDRGNIE